jgi:sirohydrochlorin cobaltochelatase
MIQPGDTLILFAHGARDPEWRVPVDALAELLRREMPDIRIDVAFLEFMRPTLSETLANAAAAGAGRVAIAPLFWAEGGHLKRELPELIADAQARHPALRIERWPVLGASMEVLAALTEVYQAQWRAVPTP